MSDKELQEFVDLATYCAEHSEKIDFAEFWQKTNQAIKDWVFNGKPSEPLKAFDNAQSNKQ